MNVDTTVQEKAITFPTDSKLCHKMRGHLIKEARLRGIDLRRTYVRVSKRALIQQSHYVITRSDKGYKNKFYSPHAPEVERIAKGKIHKKCEFGCKSSCPYETGPPRRC